MVADARAVSLCKAATRAAGVLVAATGLLGLAGWVFGLESLKTAFTFGVSIKPNAALCLLLAGGALLLLAPEGAPRARKHAGRVMAAVVAAVGGLTLLQHLFGLDFRIDQVLFSEAPGAPGTASPARMGPPASISFLLSGLALLLLDSRTKSGRAPCQWLALAVGLIALLPLIGYAYGIHSLYGISRYTGIAVQSAAAIAVLAAGLLGARPTHGLMAVITADDPGGMLARRLLVPMVALPLVLGWLRTVGERLGWYDESFGRPALILTLIGSLAALVWWSARALSGMSRHRTAAEAERERLRAEGAAHHARTAEILESISDAFYAIDADFRFTYVNRKAEELWGRRREDLVGKHYWGEFPRAVGSESQRMHLAAMSERRVTRYETISPILGRWIEVSLYPEAGGGLSCYFRDISDRKRVEDEREQLLARERTARAEAEAASRAKDEFLATLSHELRTPLTPVLLTVSLMESHPGLPQDLREDVAVIRRNVELESRLISDLLDLTRIERGKFQLDLQDVDLHLVVRSAIDICQREASARLVVDLGATRHTVHGDPTRLQQVFWNLVNNAIKFTEPQGTITVRSRDADGDRVRVEVTDTGAGIDPATLPKLFYAFEQGDVRASRKQAGLGLGLAISRRLAEAHGGTITAHSEGRGRGATFAVELPLVAAVASRPAAPPAAPAEPAAPALDVLLVEDHEPTLDVMTRLLRKLGHRVTGVTTVASATAAASQDGFDLIISDLGLPDGSGLDVMRKLRDKYAGRAIALTGYGMESDIAASRDAGFTAHLIKPVDFATLKSTIHRVASPRAQ